MFPTSRAVLAVVIAGLSLVGIAAGIRLQQQQDVAGSTPVSLTGAQTPSGYSSLTVDPSFLASSPSPSPAPGASPASVIPSSPVVPVVAPAPTVSAETYLVGDLNTGKIYLEKNTSIALPIASMTKLVTAVDAIGTYGPSAEIQVTEPETEVPPDASNLQPGERFTLNELLYPLLLDSSNVAAEAIASSTNRTAFIVSMASYAEEIGMTDAHFDDPSGLSQYNVASARDFMALATYLYHSRPDILNITRTPSLSVGTTTDHGAHEFVSIHPFIDDPRFLGGKTGFTNAAQDTMLTMLNLDGHPIAIIVLHSLDRTKDTTILENKVLAMLSN